MQLYELDPLSDKRWENLAASHADSSVFHQTGWIRALAKTYGYRPLVLTSAPAGRELTDGIVFCEVESWVTGKRLVSLPFTDHAEPLLEDGGGFDIHHWIQSERQKRKWKYVEFRPFSGEMRLSSPLPESQTFWLHTLDLSPSPEKLFANLHRSCLQRRIRHAERQRLSYDRGQAEDLLNEFYKLLMLTRKRFGLLPQPRSWFKNLFECMGSSAEIRIARKAGSAVAGLVTLRHRDTVVYKYGCSDAALHHLAGTPFLFWKMIQESRAEGAKEIDFGRSDLDNDGLIRFKDRFGTSRRRLSYFRHGEKERAKYSKSSEMPATRRFVSLLPEVLSSKASGLVYRHIG